MPITATSAVPPPSRRERAWRGVQRSVTWVPRPLAVTADLVAVGTLLVWLYQLFDGPGTQVVTATFVCVVAGLSVILAFRMQYELFAYRLRSDRAMQLARAQPALADASKLLSDAAQCMGVPERNDEVRVIGKDAMERLAEAFSSISGAACRVTVKQTSLPDAAGQMTVQDLFRSHTANYPVGQVDWMHENTHFEDLLAANSTFWMTDDLKVEYAGGYRNSHITGEMVRNDQLPYRSVLVVRIGGAGASAPAGALQGFLCIDSLAVGVFRRDFDVSTAETFAHALYSILTWFRQRGAAVREEHHSGDDQ